MLGGLLHTLSLSVSTTVYLRKYGGIWGLKQHLHESPVPDRKLLKVYNSYFGRYGSWIGYSSQFAGIPCFPHGAYGIFISGGAKIGRNAVIFQHVTIGADTLNGSEQTGAPVIGDNVYIGAGAKIIGSIHVGNNCRIGANAVVYRDLPPDSLAVQSPTRILQRAGLDNRYYSLRDGVWYYYRDGDWVPDPARAVPDERGEYPSDTGTGNG